MVFFANSAAGRFSPTLAYGVIDKTGKLPRNGGAREGDGYLLATVYRDAEKRSDLAIFDATALEQGPIAVAELAHRVPHGFHGNWRPAA